MIVAIGPSSFGDVDPRPLEKLRAAGFQIRENPFKRRLTEAEIITHLQGVDGLLAGLEPLHRGVLSAAGQLRALARVGIGMANVDQKAALELGIKVSNTPFGPTEAVAEMTLCAALTLLRGLIPRNEALHRREWPKNVTLGLSSLPVLFVGYGRIGRKTADLFRMCGAEILVFDPFLKADGLKNGERYVTLEEGLAVARVVTIHAGGEEELLGADEIRRLPRGSFILNSARGELVSESAVCDALDDGHLAGVWCDAFVQEPYSGRLCDYPQALLTPHSSTYTEQCRRSMESEAVDNLLRDMLP